MENTIPEEMVTITAKEYAWLQKCEEKLLALEGAGVDNWSGYDYAMEYLRAANNEAAEDLSDD